MNNGRNASERKAISALINLTDPKRNYSEWARRSQCNYIIKNLTDAAIKEVRKEFQHQAPVANAFISILQEEADEERTAKEIVAEQMEKEGKTLSRAAYEEAPPPPSLTFDDDITEKPPPPPIDPPSLIED